MYKVAYTADIHGNEAHYSRLVDFAIKNSLQAIIIGGDIAPKGIAFNDFIKVQRDFLDKKLPELLKPLKSGSTNIEAYLMMGNDDCSSNLDVFKDCNEYQVIHGKRIKIAEDLDLVGYSCVPITPFGIKDWEKFDLTSVPLRHKLSYSLKDRNMKGFKSSASGWTPMKFSDKDKDESSIEKDLSDKLYRENSENTVYIVHSPPHATNLDMIHGGEHVGSFAIKQFIKEVGPKATLHGHIHETVDISGRFKNNIGKSVCLSPGNDHTAEKLAILVLDLYKPDEAERIFI